MSIQEAIFKVGDQVRIVKLCKRLIDHGLELGMMFTLTKHPRSSKGRAYYHYGDNADLKRRYDEHAFYMIVPPIKNGVDWINVPQDCLDYGTPLDIIDAMPVGVSV